LRLISEDPTGHSRVEQDWPWAFLPGKSYVDQLRGLFPWSDKRIDEARYRRQTYPAFVAQHGTWSDAEGYYTFDKDFDTWFATNYADQLKPYATISDGAAALWRLELRLNDQGRAALAEEERIMHEQLLEDYALEQELANERAAGRYTGQVLEDRRGGYWYNVVFEAGDRGDSLLMSREGWSKPQQVSRMATAILRDAQGIVPTLGWVEAFLARFGDVFADDDGNPWEIKADELRDWFGELRPAS